MWNLKKKPQQNRTDFIETEQNGSCQGLGGGGNEGI